MNTVKHKLMRIYGSLPRVPSTNYKFRSFDVNPYELLPPDPVVLDLASNTSRGTYGFGAPPAGTRLICLDIEAAEGVDIVADAHQLPFLESGSVDCVLCVSFLYAARHPDQVISEVYRVLKPGGIFYVSVPYVFPRCSDPGDFYRFSYTGLEVLCEEFERLDGGFNRGPASTMHELIVRFLAMMFCFNRPSLYTAWRYFLKWPLFWIKYLDRFMARYSMASEIYSGAYFIGKKPGCPKYENAPAFGYAAATERTGRARTVEPTTVYAANYLRNRQPS